MLIAHYPESIHILLDSTGGGDEFLLPASAAPQRAFLDIRGCVIQPIKVGSSLLNFCLTYSIKSGIEFKKAKIRLVYK